MSEVLINFAMAGLIFFGFWGFIIWLAVKVYKWASALDSE